MRVLTRLSAMVLAAAVAVPLTGNAQETERRLSGRVTAVDDAPVGNAEVRLLAGDEVVRLTRTDSTGRYGFQNLVADRRLAMHVRRLGFKPNTTMVPPGASVLDVQLDAMPAELEGVLVNARVHASHGRLMQFYANRERAQFGRFFDSEEIEERNPRLMSDLMRFVPGVRLSPGRLGSLVRIRGCRPLLWIDGQRLPGAELDEFINMRDVAAVEVYNSFAGIPPQYVDRQSNCGAVVVWTKL